MLLSWWEKNSFLTFLQEGVTQKLTFKRLLCNYLGINISAVTESWVQHFFWLKAMQFLSQAHLAEKKAFSLKTPGMALLCLLSKYRIHSYCKHNFILKILLDQMPEAVASIRKEERASRRLFCFTSRGYSLVAHSVWQLRAVTGSPTGKAVAGHQLVCTPCDLLPLTVHSSFCQAALSAFFVATSLVSPLLSLALVHNKAHYKAKACWVGFATVLRIMWHSSSQITIRCG